MAKVNNKEIVLRQWFAARYGSIFEDHKDYRLPKSIADLNREYARDNPQMPVSFNFVMYKLRDIENEIRSTGKFELYDEIVETEYLSGSYVPSDTGSPAGNQRVVAAPVEVELKISKLQDMEYPSFRDFPTDTVFDQLCSDHPDLRGLMSGMVVICTGESGVGKSTLLIDVLEKIERVGEIRAKLEEIDRPVKTLYISTEMTKTDLYFFMQKMPAIGRVNTILVADYLKHGLKEMIIKAMQTDEYDVILLDSYQDLVEKMQDVLNWRAKEAENFLIGLMVEAAENLGKCIIAIQHLTKGGEYVGRTFLKHTTTAMLQLKFDKNGGRFAMFSKNRRSGSMTHIPVYFTIKDGEVKFDEAAFEQMMHASSLSKSVEERKLEMENRFSDVFSMTEEESRARRLRAANGETEDEPPVDDDD